LGFTDAFRLEYGSRIGFSILCPGIVNTQCLGRGPQSSRRIGRTNPGQPTKPAALQAYGLSPEFVGQLVAQGIPEGGILHLTHPFTLELLDKRLPRRPGLDSAAMAGWSVARA